MSDEHPLTWGEFQAAVYEQGKLNGISEDDLDSIEVARISCSPDEGVRIIIKRLDHDGDPAIKRMKKRPIYMVII